MAWNEIEYARLASFRTTKALLLFIMALIVIVASVNVSSSVLMIVFERKLDIGILKSVGAAPRPHPVVPAHRLSHRAAGTAGGIAAGLLVAVNINEVIAGMEWIVNRLPGLASLLRSGFRPLRAGVRRFHAVQQRLLSEDHPRENLGGGSDRGSGGGTAPLGPGLMAARRPRCPHRPAGNPPKGVAMMSRAPESARAGSWRPQGTVRRRIQSPYYVYLGVAMKCEICGLKDAVIHIRQIQKDLMHELHICEECAQEKGLDP